MQAIRFTSLLFMAQMSISRSTYLNGKHLVIGLQPSPIHLHVTRNASGHVADIRGVAVNTLMALSQRFNFTYSILQVNDTRLEKQSKAEQGLNYYMAQGKCDVVIGAIGMTFGRHAVMDFAEGYAYTSVSIIIPMPEELENVDAALGPFQFPVWIGLVLIMPITAAAIYYSAYPVNCKRPSDESVITTNTSEKAVVRSETTSSITQAFFQIFRVLLGQGGNFLGMRLALYFVVGSWCLGAMVITCAYNSTLISHILESKAKPLVDSASDVVENQNVNIAVNKGNGVDIILSAAVDGMYRQAGDKVRSNPKSRCTTTEECVNLVKSGSYAYLHSLQSAIDIISEDYTATGVCHLALARILEPMPGSLAWALPKHSPYTRLFSMGFMELEEAGNLEYWTKWELRKYKNATHCLEEARKKQQQMVSVEKKTKITLKNFLGPFYLLMIGYLACFVFFIHEIVHFKVNHCLKKRLASHEVISENNGGVD